MRRWNFISLFAAVVIVPVLAAPAFAVSLDGDFSQCMSCIDGLKRQLANVSLLGNVFTLVGAAMAAIGSVVAGASSGGKKSWIAGIVGVAGAIVTALPKTLPDRADIQRRISLADQHRVSGEKTMRQLSLLSDPSSATEWEKYAISRFIDCSATEPAKDVPEVPNAVEKGGPSFVAALETTKPMQGLGGISAGGGAAARPARLETLHGQAVAAAAHEAARPPQHVYKTPAECQQLPTSSLRGNCMSCVSKPQPHHFDSSDGFGERCHPEGETH